MYVHICSVSSLFPFLYITRIRILYEFAYIIIPYLAGGSQVILQQHFSNPRKASHFKDFLFVENFLTLNFWIIGIGMEGR